MYRNELLIPTANESYVPLSSPYTNTSKHYKESRNKFYLTIFTDEYKYEAEQLKGREISANLGVDGRIVLKWIRCVDVD